MSSSSCWTAFLEALLFDCFYVSLVGMAEAPEFQVSLSPCCAAFLEAILFYFFIVDQLTGFVLKSDINFSTSGTESSVCEVSFVGTMT